MPSEINHDAFDDTSSIISVSRGGPWKTKDYLRDLVCWLVGIMVFTFGMFPGFLVGVISERSNSQSGYERLWAHLESVRDGLELHKERGGHPVMETRMAAIEKRVVGLEERERARKRE